MFNNIINTLRSLSDLNYQEKFELLDYDDIFKNDDIHSALYLNSKNCVSLFENIIRISKLNMELFHSEIINDTNMIHLRLIPISKEMKFYSPQGIFYSLVHYMRKILGDKFTSESIEVSFTLNKIPDEYNFLNETTSKIVTNSSVNCISISKDMALLHNAFCNPFIDSFIENQIRKEYNIQLPSDPFLNAVLCKISDTIENNTDELSISTIANAMNMSRSTLYRSLSDRNLTFSQIIEEKRRTMSMDLLVNTSISIGEISDQLGYKNLSAFNRAFKRWFDNTPLAMRKKQ
jgi:AraC-like DNA-binding protein